MDESAPETLTFGLALRALAERWGRAPAPGDPLRLLLDGEEPCLDAGGAGDRLCALLVVAERGCELPPEVVAAVREHLADRRHLLALSTRAPERARSDPIAPASAVDEAFGAFLERWRFERIFRSAPQLAGYGRATLSLAIPSDEALIPGLSHTVGLLLREFGYATDDWMSTMPLVIDEVLTNAIRHGNRGCRDKQVRIEVAVDAREFRLAVTDEGEGFSRAGVADPRSSDRLWRPGGRGLFLIEQLMDEVEYLDKGRTVSLVRRHRGAARCAPGTAPDDQAACPRA